MTTLQETADALPPIRPHGPALTLVVVSMVALVLSYIAVGLRVWCRAIWLSNVWGWDDSLAVLALVAYTVSCAYATLAACYGLGVPDSQLDPLTAYQTRALEYNVYWEVCYLFSAALTKTSIGVASIRIALERKYLYTLYFLIGISNAVCIGGIIWELAACQPIATRWNREAGSCAIPGIVPIAYAISMVTVITDAGSALVPLLILRGISMRPRVKYALMVVLAMGSIAALVSVARFPFVGYLTSDITENYLYRNVWIPLLSQIECATGLIAGSLPGIGKMFHFFDPPIKTQAPPGPEAWAALQTVGGSPLSDVSIPERCQSAGPSVRRPSVPVVSVRKPLMGVRSIESIV